MKYVVTLKNHQTRNGTKNQFLISNPLQTPTVELPFPYDKFAKHAAIVKESLSSFLPNRITKNLYIILAPIRNKCR
jgi:hypothetical protein